MSGLGKLLKHLKRKRREEDEDETYRYDIDTIHGSAATTTTTATTTANTPTNHVNNTTDNVDPSRTSSNTAPSTTNASTTTSIAATSTVAPEVTLEAVVLIGINGCGKSTFASTYFAKHAIVARKFMRPRKNYTRDRKEQLAIETRLRERRNIVVDSSSHIRVAQRERILGVIRNAAKSAGVGVRIVGIAFRNDARLCFERNETRHVSTRLLTEARLRKQRQSLQWPSSSERFDELLYAKEEYDAKWSLLPYVPNCHRIYENDDTCSDDDNDDDDEDVDEESTDTEH
jgi:predicted kinase